MRSHPHILRLIRTRFTWLTDTRSNPPIRHGPPPVRNSLIKGLIASLTSYRLFEIIKDYDVSVPIAQVAEEHQRRHGRALRIAVDEADWVMLWSQTPPKLRNPVLMPRLRRNAVRSFLKLSSTMSSSFPILRRSSHYRPRGPVSHHQRHLQYPKSLTLGHQPPRTAGMTWSPRVALEVNQSWPHPLGPIFCQLWT